MVAKSLVYLGFLLIRFMRRLIRKLIDWFFVFPPIKALCRSVLGPEWRGKVLKLIGYRAIHMVDKGECAFLCGVFNSATALNYSRSVGPSGRVVVCEANPDNVVRMKRELAGIENITLVNYAIWNEETTMQLLVSNTEECGFDRLASDELEPYPDHMNTQPHEVPVICKTLDSIAEELGIEVIHHLNLTINGAELQGVDGISRIREKNPDLRIYINTEYPNPCNAVVDKLKVLSFKIYMSELTYIANKKIRLMRVYALPIKR